MQTVMLQKQTKKVNVQDEIHLVYFLTKNKNTVKSRLILDKKNVLSTLHNSKCALCTGNKSKVLPESVFNLNLPSFYTSLLLHLKSKTKFTNYTSVWCQRQRLTDDR